MIALLAAASAHNRAVVSIPPPVPTAGVPYGLFITFHFPSNTPTSSTLKVECPHCVGIHDVLVRETYINSALQDAAGLLGGATSLAH